MTTSERFKKFDADLARLKSNREKIPLEQLTTRYAKAYNALVADLEEFAEWFTGEYIKTLAIPRHPNDEAGNAWLQQKLDEWDALGDRKWEPANMWGYNFIIACFDDLNKFTEKQEE